MTRTNRTWLPSYCEPNAFLPKIQETRTLFSNPPYLFGDFVGRALRFLQSETVEKTGFRYVPDKTLPCQWKCADESVFGATLAIYGYTGQYPFDKGGIGGMFNQNSVGAAVHHGAINVDFGGAHTGYLPGPHGGSFGSIWRPLQQEFSTDCGHLMSVLSPFRQVYDDACQSILVISGDDDRLMLSVPNEFIQPNWSGQSVKLIVDLDNLTSEDVPYDVERPQTHTPLGRSLFYLHPAFIENLPDDVVRQYHEKRNVPIGLDLTHQYFHIFDTDTALDAQGIPLQRLNLYMKYILSSRYSSDALKVAIVKTSLEQNKLTDTVRSPMYREYSFASFTGIFLDLYHEPTNNYVNLFQPVGLSIKPAGSTQCVEWLPEEIFRHFDMLEPIEPAYMKLGEPTKEDVRGILESFTYQPGYFTRS